MDDFKRYYSNEDEQKSIPYFWQKFDPKHYSIWYAEYKYPEELRKVFMSCNLITGKVLPDVGDESALGLVLLTTKKSFFFPGMYQRLDKMRKNAFASMILFGTDNDSTISGIWVWRGQNLAFEVSA